MGLIQPAAAFVHKVTGIQPYPSIYILSVAASLLQGQILYGLWVRAFQRNRTSRIGVGMHIEIDLFQAFGSMIVGDSKSEFCRADRLETQERVDVAAGVQSIPSSSGDLFL